MIIANKKSDMVRFDSLSTGSVFKDAFTNYCMKTVCHNDVNFVYLSDGSLGYMEDYDEVERVRCELNVGN